MNNSSFKMIAVCMTAVFMLPLTIGAQEGSPQPPPVAAPLVREGAFAMKLAEALNVGQPSSEAEAESMLGAVGIAPLNGWMADYPVTPDIIGELRDSVAYAAKAKTISMDPDTALRTLEGVQADFSVSVTPAPAGPPDALASQTAPAPAEEGAPIYPDQTFINDYYSSAGPPIVTYYAPPPDYYYLYGWVPYPFWWGGYWFGGYFILNDFHRHHRDHHGGRFISNHFNDVNAHRVFRVDPVNRLRGRTFEGIGAPRANSFLRTGVKGSRERIFNRDLSGFRSRLDTLRSQPGGTGAVRQPSMGTRSAVNPFKADRVYSKPPGAGPIFSPQSGQTGGSRTFSAPGGGGRTFNAPSGGGGRK